MNKNIYLHEKKIYFHENKSGIRVNSEIEKD